jgi:hypothetical protein
MYSLESVSAFFLNVSYSVVQDEGETTPKAHKDKSLDSSLFDDKVDIFADLTAISKPKEKKFKKVETKSIFHDDMGGCLQSTYFRISCIVCCSSITFNMHVEIYTRHGYTYTHILTMPLPPG